jgi:hypothetical protein
MPDNIPELIKQIRETADFLLTLPQKIVAAVMGTRHGYFAWKERIAAQRELAAVREVGKKLQTLYFWKGDMIAFINSIDFETELKFVTEFRQMFGEIADGLDELQEILKETAFSNTKLATDAALLISKASRSYRSMSALPESSLCQREVLRSMGIEMERLTDAGGELIQQLDDQRRVLDHTYIWKD